MATVKKIERPRCEWERFDPNKRCKRQANFLVTWSDVDGKTVTWALCYRHRWRARDVVEEKERSVDSAIEAKAS